MAKRSKFWTVQEELLLKENARNKTLVELQELFPDRSLDSIARKIERMGLSYISPNYLWTKEEEELLRKLAPQSRFVELRPLFPDRTPNAIKMKIKNMGLTYLKCSHIWTEEEINYLKTNWVKMPTKEIARNLHLGLHTIYVEAEKLNLSCQSKKSRKKWTDAKLKELRILSREMSIKELANHFKTTYNAIRTIANKNGIHLLKKDHCWTNEEDLFLRKLVDSGYSLTEIAGLMHKTDVAILSYAKRENIIIKTNKPQVWNSDTDEKLKALVAVNQDIFAIMETIKFSDITILKNARRLNLNISVGTKKAWSKVEEGQLCNLAKTKTLNELVIILRRSSKSIRWKADTLGIKLLIDKNIWTEEDLAILKEMVENRKTLADIMAALGRTSKAIKQKMALENLVLKNSGRPWAKDEEDLLKELWGTCSPSKIASILYREPSAICQRSTKLKLGSQIKNNYDGLGVKEICEIFRVSPTVITITWVALGLKLKVRNTSNVSSYKYVVLEDLMEFLRLNQNIWDSRPLEWYALGYEPDWLKEKRKKDGLLPRNFYGAINVEKQLIRRKEMNNIKEVGIKKC